MPKDRVQLEEEFRVLLREYRDPSKSLDDLDRFLDEELSGKVSQGISSDWDFPLLSAVLHKAPDRVVDHLMFERETDLFVPWGKNQQGRVYRPIYKFIEDYGRYGIDLLVRSFEGQPDETEQRQALREHRMEQLRELGYTSLQDFILDQKTMRSRFGKEYYREHYMPPPPPGQAERAWKSLTSALSSLPGRIGLDCFARITAAATDYQSVDSQQDLPSQRQGEGAGFDGVPPHSPTTVEVR